MDSSPLACNGVTSFETHLDEAPTILLCCKYGGPHAGLVDKCRPTKPANVCQLQEVVQAVSAWRRDESEDLEEYFDGGFVNEVLRSLELEST